MAASNVPMASRQVCRRLLFCRSSLAIFSPKCQLSDDTKAQDNDNEAVVSSSSGETPESSSVTGPRLGGFAKAFARHAQVDTGKDSADTPDTDPLEDEVPFAELFRNSSHVHIGAIQNQIVLGKIFHIVEDDLYIDFGGKFHCVCTRPQENAEKYHRGAKVRLRLKDLELTDHFVGATRDLTLLEADAELLGLAKQK
ncbi:small ribosomal subunit protein bS1m-like [Diadema setosum]|uniref:small ribosomal subunit protein bS1m-like n=1 Tax=Diadema setosum TaxID=31175 RepID=UPI003B3B5CBC